MRKDLRALAAAAVAILLLRACATRPGENPSDEGPNPPSRAVVHDVGRSASGRPIRAHLLGTGKRTILLLATIHGNEAAGTPLLIRLAREIAGRPELLSGRRIVLVPIANPDGKARGTRGNARRVDLNRNFPAASFRPGRRTGARPLSEPESRTLHDLVLRHSPDLVVTLHEPMGLVDWDGPAEGPARAMARAAGLPAKRIGARPGSLGSWVGLTLGRPIVTVELPRSAARLTGEELWTAYGSLLLAAVTWDPRSTQ